ncbi:MAG: hypothetical protein K2X01_11740 [Cyanobacteria bacterium]|nr:hypothetical protein [Cyanobacteriota bacterium]
MVDQVSGRNLSLIQDSTANLLGSKAAQTEEVNRTAAQAASTAPEKIEAPLSYEDNVTISSEAKHRYEKEKEVLRFSRLAQRSPNQVDDSKVSSFRQLIEHGRINDYLRSLNTDQIAASILNSPAKAFLNT